MKENIYVPETMAQSKSHYNPPNMPFISCRGFGHCDGMNGSCHWCMEMTPYQFEMCRDESWVRSLLKHKSKEEAIKFIDEYKQKHYGRKYYWKDADFDFDDDAPYTGPFETKEAVINDAIKYFNNVKNKSCLYKPTIKLWTTDLNDETVSDEVITGFYPVPPQNDNSSHTSKENESMMNVEW